MTRKYRGVPGIPVPRWCIYGRWNPEGTELRGPGAQGQGVVRHRTEWEVRLPDYNEPKEKRRGAFQ